MVTVRDVKRVTFAAGTCDFYAKDAFGYNYGTAEEPMWQEFPRPAQFPTAEESRLHTAIALDLAEKLHELVLKSESKDSRRNSAGDHNPAVDRQLLVGTDCSGIEAPLQALDNLGVDYKHVFS